MILLTWSRTVVIKKTSDENVGGRTHCTLLMWTESGANKMENWWVFLKSWATGQAPQSHFWENTWKTGAIGLRRQWHGLAHCTTTDRIQENIRNIHWLMSQERKCATCSQWKTQSRNHTQSRDFVTVTTR